VQSVEKPKRALPVRSALPLDITPLCVRAPRNGGRTIPGVLERTTTKALPLLNRAVEAAPAAQACCGVCRTCATTNALTLLTAGLAGLGLAGARFVRRLRIP